MSQIVYKSIYFQWLAVAALRQEAGSRVRGAQLRSSQVLTTSGKQSFLLFDAQAGWRRAELCDIGGRGQAPRSPALDFRIVLDFPAWKRETIVNAGFRRWTARKGWRESGPERGLFI